MSTLSITQVKSSNGANGRQRDTLRSLGLRRIGHTVERPGSSLPLCRHPGTARHRNHVSPAGSTAAQQLRG